jgi:16S rRNA (uracil1498-N3)-methyltransferase
MNTRRFFSDSSPGVNSPGATLSINGDELHHLRHVNRAKCGDIIEVINGKGSLYTGEIRAFKPGEAIIDIKQEETCDKPGSNIIIAISILKQRPMGILIEKLSEMGIDEIQPIIFTRTDEKYNPSRLKKWQKIAIQSLKVNKRLWSTVIHEPLTFAHFITYSARFDTKLMLDISGDIATTNQWPHPILAVIGPPGDYCEDERAGLVKNGFMRYNINDAVLKSETAAISIAAILKNAIKGKIP